MKTYGKILIVLSFFFAFTLWSCEDYLEKTPKADINDELIFSSFENFQGYVETMYDDMVDPIHLTTSFGSFNNGDDILPTRYRGFIEGAYFWVISSGNTQYYNTRAVRSGGTWNPTSITRQMAIWQNSWYGIRAANITLKRLPQLVDATPEQKQLIEGQAYFFRGYFHWELMKAWGNIPYIDSVFSATDDMKVPQEGLYKTAEKILADFQKAADLLPVSWDSTETGKVTFNKNFGRATKGMALSNMAECLLYCGSPLWNGVETGNYSYNTAYCKRAADAAWKVIDIANKTGVYGLVTWANYKNNFYKKDNTFPMTKEIIFSPPQRGNSRYFTSEFTFGHIGTDAWYAAPTQNYVELFETSTGLPIDDPASGYNPNDPWNNRDPRFRYNILVDGDRQVVRLTDDRAFVQFYMGGRERTAITSLTGYGWRKYWDETLNVFDNGWNQYYYNVPKIRFAEIYLFFAEAANEAYGPTAAVPGAGLTAQQAVDIVRARANMPPVNAKFLGSTETFRDRIWNERAVELAYENKRWYDLRRWHVGHLPKYRELYELQFDKNHTYFNRVLARTIQFSEQHYWLPFPVNQVALYPGWKQNPGW